MADADALREPGLPGVPLTPEPARPPTASPGDDAVMPLLDHLGELRTRLFRCLLAVTLGGVVGFYFSKQIRDFLIAPLPGGTVQTLGLGDAFMIQVRIALVVGIVLAMPVLLYQGWAFIAPGLTPAERKASRPGSRSPSRSSPSVWASRKRSSSRQRASSCRSTTTSSSPIPPRRSTSTS